MSVTFAQTVEVLVLLAAANGGPVLATRLLDGRWGWPVDGGLNAWDGRPLFGVSKTVRGLVVGIVLTVACAMAMGLGWRLGVTFGAVSMVGDLFSSFTKRRLGIESSGQAMGLDQIPEALFPLLACREALALTPVAVLLLVALFTLAQMLVSPLMYLLGIRRRPY